MQKAESKFSKSLIVSIALHVIFFTLLIITVGPTAKPIVKVNLAKDPHAEQKIVKATMVDKHAVDQAIQRQALEEKKRQDLALAEQQRAEQLQREAEQAKQAVELAKAQKAKLEAMQAKKDLELAKAQKAKQETEAKKAATEKAKIAQQQLQAKKQLEQQKLQAKKELEKQQIVAKEAAAQKAKAEALRAQQAALKAQQDHIVAQHQEFILSEVEKYRAAFQTAIEDNRILTSVFNGDLICKIRIKLLPDGSIASVNIVEPSPNPAYDQMSIKAVYQSAPFPMPQDDELYSQLRDIILSFKNGEQQVDAL